MARTNEELIELARAGDQVAERELFERNQRFSYHLAKKYLNGERDLEDLASIANIGLLKAYKRFDPKAGSKFITFASRCMTNEILMSIRRDKKHVGHMSLDAAINTDSEGNELSLLDVLEGGDNVESTVEQRAELDTARDFVKSLGQLDQQLVNMIFLSELKQNEAGRRLNISQSYISKRIRGIQDKAKRFLARATSMKGGEQVAKMTDGQLKYVTETYSTLKQKEIAEIFGVTTAYVSVKLKQLKVTAGSIEADDSAESLVRNYLDVKDVARKQVVEKPANTDSLQVEVEDDIPLKLKGSEPPTPTVADIFDVNLTGTTWKLVAATLAEALATVENGNAGAFSLKIQLVRER